MRVLTSRRCFLSQSKALSYQMVVHDRKGASRKEVGGYVEIACIQCALSESCGSKAVSRDVGEGSGEDAMFSGAERWGPVMLVRVVEAAT